MRFALPLADTKRTSYEQNMARQQRGEALEFSHSLQNQIGGQLKAGLTPAAFYWDYWDTQISLLKNYIPTFMATLAVKPELG